MHPGSQPAPLWQLTSRPLRRRSAGYSPSGSNTVNQACWVASPARSPAFAITPASGFVKPFPALLIGFLAGVFCFFMVTAVKSKFGYDDTLDAFGVHGAGGTLGALLTGVFATNAINDGLKNAAGTALPLGLVDGHAGQILNQAAGVAIAWALAIVGSLVILKIVDLLIGVRADPEEEIEGLD